MRVTTPGGTDIRFSVGDRPFNKQDGDASKARIAHARMRVDREDRAAGRRDARGADRDVGANGVHRRRRRPACSACGRDWHPPGVRQRQGRQGDGRNRRRRTLDAYLASSPTLTSFRELGLGLNPKLAASTGRSLTCPYYGYGDAVVRLSLGDNTEVAGAVRGGGSRWLFFDDTTITVGGDRIVENGRLTAAYR